MTDFLDVKRGEIRSRLDKLAPAVAEYAQLEAAAKALASINGAGPTRTTASAPVRRGRPRKSGSASPPKVTTATRAVGRPRGKAGRPRGGGRAEQALEAIQSRPGITIPEIAREIGVAAQYLYRLLPPLQKDGKISKRGKGWHRRGA
ncbi:MAG: winged helix-turn-helix domain-containing protein [Solirubrobacteraceae bacterium]